MSGDEKESEAVFLFGGPCPPIPSFFFPNDPAEKTDRNQDKDEQDSTAQSP